MTTAELCLGVYVFAIIVSIGHGDWLSVGFLISFPFSLRLVAWVQRRLG